MAGRGDSAYGVYTLNRGTQGVLNLANQINLGSATHKACNMMPKQLCSTKDQEVMRVIRASNQNKIEIQQLCIPSRVGAFDQDYYPPFTANKASSTAAKYLAGEDVPAATMQLGPEKKKAGGKGGLNRLKTKTTADLEESKSAAAGGDDTEALKARIAQLEKDLAAARASGSSANASTAEDLSTKPVLGYWAIRGLAAQIRMMFYYLKVDFEDKLYETGDAPDFDKTSWTDVKHTLGMEYPNLPYLIDGETKITETVAIMMYIAKKY